MIQTGFESKVKIQQIINNQLPEFILDESPKTSEFLKQYYISQEYQGGPIDIADNLDQYLKLDNLTPEVVVDSTYITSGISSTDTIIPASSTKGFPQTYGLLKIDNEVITYTGTTTNSFTGCVRGFSGITSYHASLNEEELVFSDTTSDIHSENTSVQNLSSLFLKEFYKKLKYTFTPGLENYSFNSKVDVGNFIKEARSFYRAKGTDESFRILFNILYGVTPTIVNLEEFLIKPSSANYIRRGIVIAEIISGDPLKLVGQSITKSSNPDINIDSASVSEIESFNRNNKQYFKISLYISNDSDSADLDFGITPTTKSLEHVAVGSSIISVDSTIGFGQTGTIVSGTNSSITYTNKSVNQFFGCKGIESIINPTDNIRSGDVYYGYENGDPSKKVELRLTGVLSKFEQTSDNLRVNEGDVVSVKNIGELIRNPVQNRTYREIFANSWLYNTSSSFDIQNFGTNLSLTLKDSVDRSGLKVGDEVEILVKGESKSIYPTELTDIPRIENISFDNKSIGLFGFNFQPAPNTDYVLRRKVNKANSTNVPIKYGNNVVLSDIQNLYVDQKNEYAYVASNSLPSSSRSSILSDEDLSVPYTYQITKDIIKASINSIDNLTNFVGDGKYSTITFDDLVPFVNGDRVYYEADYSLNGLEDKTDYYIEVLSDKKTIRIYYSRSFIDSKINYLTFGEPKPMGSPFGTHKFTLYSQRVDEIGPQRILKKFSLIPDIATGNAEETIPGATGMLINGVEINNYKSNNKIYYGPLKSVNVMNGGDDYDVINPPLLEISSGFGTNALIQPIIEGNIKQVYIDPQEFDINRVKTISIKGGNGSGAIIEPVISVRAREVSFDARETTNSGGINTATNQVRFITNHNFINGEEVIYNNNSNLSLGIGVGSSTLVQNGKYYVSIDNNTSVTLYDTYADYESGNNIEFSGLNAAGLHKFRTNKIKNTVSEIKVIRGGKGYTNRKLIVKPVGISTLRSTVTFNNHGFKDGELINYSYNTDNLVTNGDFSDGTTGWQMDPTASAGTISVINGQLQVKSDSNGVRCQALQTLDTKVGEKYILFCDILGGTASSKEVRLSNSASSTMDAIIYNYCWDYYQYFDADGDGIVSPTDALLILRYLIGSAFDPDNDPIALTNNVYMSSDATRTTSTEIWNWIDNHRNNTVINRGTYNGTDIGDKSVYDLDATGTVTALGDGLMLRRIFGSITGTVPNLSIEDTNLFLNPHDGGPAQWDNVNLKWVMGSYSRQSIPQFGMGIVDTLSDSASPYWDANSISIYTDISGADLGSKSYEFTAVSDKLYIQPRIDSNEANVTAIFDNFYLKTAPIVGLSTANQYKILKIDDDTFQLADASTITSVYADLKSQIYQGVINDNIELVTDGAFSNSTNWRLGSNCTISNGIVSLPGGWDYTDDYIRQKPVTPFVEGHWYVLTANLVAGTGTNIAMVNRNQSGVSQGNGSTVVDVYCEVVGEKLIAMWKQSSVNLNEISLFSTSATSFTNLSIKEVPELLYSDSNYNRRNFVIFNSVGAGYQYFSYPKIEISLKYSLSGIGTATQKYETLKLTPDVRGSIIDTYLYEPGTGYGSNVLNFEKNQIVTIKSGREAQLEPHFLNGVVVDVSVNFGGYEYYSTPDLQVIDSSGSGSGAKLRPVISNGQITDVIIASPGIGYSSTNTSIHVKSRGSNASFKSKIRSLTVNNNIKYGNEYVSQILSVAGGNLEKSIGNVDYGYIESENKLQYAVNGYFNTLRDSFQENSTIASNIIGWAYDGNPIYGPYTYSNNEDQNSSVERIKSGYTIDISNVIDRPLGFIDGYFVEDYVYTASGDLDKNNGRYGKTPEFPEGVYAYFATIDELGDPSFPYFIGNNYRSNTLSENNSLNQELDFNNSGLLRNTFPYNVSKINSNNDFLIETNEITGQLSVIDSITDGPITDFDIVDPGTGYKVDDILTFDNEDTEGGGLFAKIVSVKGETITNVNTNTETYNNSVLSWNNENQIKINILPHHPLSDGDEIVLSGFVTSLTYLNNSYKIGVTSYTSSVYKEVPSSMGAATTELYISTIPSSVSIGSSIVIGSETLKILNIYNNLNLIRVKRGTAGVGIPTSSIVRFLPDSFTVSAGSSAFKSKVNDKAYFNPTESIGVGTTGGIANEITLTLGDSSITRSILHKTIYLENHPFKDNQEVIFTRPNTGTAPVSISTSPEGNAWNIPGSGLTKTKLYVTNKTINSIGIKTALGTDHNGNPYEEVYFRTNGQSNDEYSFETVYPQITSKVQKIIATVSVSTYHGLAKNDSINLNIKPKLSVGVGSSESINVSFNNKIQNVLVNPVGFTSDSVIGPNGVDNLGIGNHGLRTGDKVYYEANGVASGLSTGPYYVYKINDDSIRLCETYIDSKKNPPTTISIGSSGGSDQKLSLINPSIPVIKNNNLVFNLSDSSLEGYSFRIYYDNKFNNEFVSVATTDKFSLVGVGSTGVSENASLTLTYSDNLPEKLYYTLEKGGYISSSDSSVNNYSEISFVDSDYNSSYSIGSTTPESFKISLNKIPENISYAKTDCSLLEYTTNSVTAKGPIDNINIVSGGTGYKKIPIFTGSNSVSGDNAHIIASSNQIGDIKDIRIINEGFEYSSDKTLQPQAFISPFITIRDSNTIGIVTVIDGGKNYTEPPRIEIVDGNSRKSINSGFLRPILKGSAISSIDIVQPPKGLSDKPVELFTVNNSNGISVLNVDSSATGIFTCSISTPILGFHTSPFKQGDKVFVEGIQKVGTAGSGFNSSDYGYQLLTVSEYVDARFNTTPYNADLVKFDVSGLTTNTGIAKTIQDAVGILVNEDNYPTFTLTHKISPFIIGEKLVANGNEIDLRIADFEEAGFIKVSGTYELSLNEVISGRESGNIAKVDNLFINSGRYKVSYVNDKNIGWSDNIGKLNEDIQVTPNNDYYQNLSYTIKSPIQYKDLKIPVDSLVHTSGLKNFSDTGISSTPKYIGMGSESTTTIFRDIIRENRVDVLYDFDNVYDIDTVGNTSKFIKLQNKKLTDYTENKSNRVLRIDDLNKKFSNVDGEPSTFLNISKLGSIESYEDYFVRISNIRDTSVQLVEFILVNDGSNNFILNKGLLVNAGSDINHKNNELLGDFALIQDAFGDSYLRFDPIDPYDTDYDLKVIKNEFIPSLSGVGTESVGFVDLTSFSGIVTSGNSGITSSIIGVATDKFNSLFVNSKVIDNSTNEINFVELYVSHNGTDTYVSESYFDSEDYGYSVNTIGAFSANIDAGVLNVNYTNDTLNDITVKSSIVGFGTIAVGIGTYRFKLDREIAGNERSAIYQSNFTSTTASSVEILSLDKFKFNASKSIIEVGMGVSKALHQVMMLHDQEDVYNQQAQFLSIGSNSIDDYISGIGTFGSEISGNNFILKFYPDAEMTSEINISVFSECLYTDVDFVNVPPSLVYGNSKASISNYRFNAINGDRINRKEFVLTTDEIPIFAKEFDPQDSTEVNLTTGLFSIVDHFFSTGEELIYTPQSTFVGVGSTPMTYGGTPVPSTVYAIRENDDEFKIAITRSNAIAGNNIVFDSYGEGNAHQFAMANNNSKSLITIDNVAQYPILYTPITHTLSGNDGGQIGIAQSIFTLSGISSLKTYDTLKIDDEYMIIDNVGVGTTSVGPITGIGISNLVKVQRGKLGSSASTHNDGAVARLYKGSFNIKGNQIFFTQAPRGNPQIDRDESNLEFETSDFLGRVFLRNDYTTNQIYDDISDQFTGLTSSFTLTVGGGNTIGIGSTGGSGILFINSIFQTPTTENNPNNNFEIIEDAGSGITTAIFTGITSSDGSIFKSVSDVNRNQLPRGGLIVSLGSTFGKGYAPLVGAKIEPVIDSSSGTIWSDSPTVTGGSLSDTTDGFNGNTSSGAYCNLTATSSNAAANATFAASIPNVTLVEVYAHSPSPHGDTRGTCLDSTGATHTSSTITNESAGWYTIYSGSAINLVNVGWGINQSATGTSSDGFRAFRVNGLILTDGVNNPPSGKSITGIIGIGTTVSALSISTASYDNKAGILSVTTTNDHGFVLGIVNDVKMVGLHFTCSGSYNVEGADYNQTTGNLTLAIGYHHFTVGKSVQIDNNSLTFTCNQDGYGTNHTYPRSGTDPMADGVGTPVIGVGDTTITINVGVGTTAIHKFVGATAGALKYGNEYVGVTTTIFPDVANDRAFAITGILSSRTFTADVGTSTVTHYYVGQGTVFGWKGDLTFGSGYNDIINIGVAVTDAAYEHKFVSVATSAITANSGGPFTPTDATYSSHNGLLKLTIPNHNLTSGSNVIGIATESLTFTCSRDNHATEHSYPRLTDPVHNETSIAIASTTLDTITLNVGAGGGKGSGAVIKAYPVGVNTHTFISAIAGAAKTGGNYTHNFVSCGVGSIVVAGIGTTTATNAAYTPSSGNLVLTIPGHSYTTSNVVGIATESLTFTCSRDNHATEHSYPRLTDPVHNNFAVAISAVSTNTITVNVGATPFVSQNVGFATYVPKTGIMNVTVPSTANYLAQSQDTVDNAIYDPVSGIMTVTVNSHGYLNGDYVKFLDNSLIFTCDKDGNNTEHRYPRFLDPLSDRWVSIANTTSNTFEVQVLDSIPSTNITNHTFVSADTNGLKKANTLIDFTEKSLIFTCAQDSHSTRHAYPRNTDPIKISQLGIETVNDATSFNVNVGKSPNGSGGALEFALESGGTNYCNPEIYVSEPSYENLEVEGLSRLSVGNTTDTGVGLLVDVAVSAAQTTGIGSDSFDISEFSISRQGYNFEDGDVIRPVGLVTHRRLQSTIQDFSLTVTDTFTDSFAVWQFGEFDYIDSIKNYQDGKRVRFPLYYNNDLLSFEKAENSRLDLNNALFIVINGVIQDPGNAYVFEGGTSFSFTFPPKPEDNVAVFFYRGTRGSDDIFVTSISQTLERGDDVQVLKNNAIDGTITQNKRVVYDLSYSDKFETNLYLSQGIDEINPKPLSVIKQKVDRVINGEPLYKTRDSIESLVYPVAKVIGDLGISDNQVFVDNSELFGYDSATKFGGFILSKDSDSDYVSGIIKSTVAAGSTISLSIGSSGSGYIGTSAIISISAPPEIGVGIGTTAIAEIAIDSFGNLATPITITNPGFGYTIAPQAIVSSPDPVYNNINDITSVQGFSGIVTGITTCSGIGGANLALQFTLYRDPNFNNLNVGYPIYIYNTRIGTGVTSIYNSDSASIGIGTEFLDNIYRIDAISSDSANPKIGIITCNIQSDSNVIGLGVTMNIENPVGQFSWGRLSGFTFDGNSPVSMGVTGKTVNLGLTTFPTIQRRGVGLRETGALPKRIT